LKSNKFWLLILGGVVVASAIIALLFWRVAASETPAVQASIYKNGELTRTVGIPLITIRFNVTVQDRSSFNTIEVERGRLRMSDASCPDGVCIRQGWKSGGVMPIVCLPNRVVVTFEGGSADNGVDAVVG